LPLASAGADQRGEASSHDAKEMKKMIGFGAISLLE